MPFDIQPSALILCMALSIDVFFGEWPKAIHPVVWVGRGIALLQRLAPVGPWYLQLTAGMLMAVIVPAGCVMLTLLALWALAGWPLASSILGVYLLKSTFALRALGAAAREVQRALMQGDFAAARGALRHLCGRDAQALNAPLMLAATAESLAENASDSFIAPLFFYLLFGLPGAVFYRAVNTLDAMVGYRGVYEYFGKASARLDDLLNYIPARLTAALLVCAGCFTRASVRGGLAILRRDKYKTDSPNAGWPMAAMAGLLRVQLEKPGHYRLGDAHEALVPSKIDTALWLTRGACVAAVCIVLAVLFVLGGPHVYANAG